MIVKYKVYSNDMDIRQQYTTINLENIPPIEYLNHIEDVIRKRFEEYNIIISHVSKIVKLSYRFEIYRP